MAEFLSVDQEAALELLTRAPGPSLGSAPRYPDPRVRPVPPRRVGVPLGVPDPMVALLAGIPASIEQLALAALDAGELFLGFAAVTALAAQFPAVQLGNPGSANRLVLVLSIRASVATVTAALNLVHETGIGAGFVRRARNLSLGQPPSLAEIATSSETSGGVNILGSHRVLANTPLELLSNGPVEVLPGNRVFVVSEVAADTMVATFLFRESLLV